jgi:hypothetical protein
MPACCSPANSFWRSVSSMRPSAAVAAIIARM